MKANYHTHTTWCDGKDSPEAVVLAAIGKGFDAIGFSSHAMLPEDDTSWVLTPEKAPCYAAEVRALAEKYETCIRVLCGVEADYVPGGATPDRSAYAAISRGWLDDAYPSAEFRALLRSRGVRFVLSSDAHSADALDCAFDRFAAEEEYVDSSAFATATNHESRTTNMV